MALSSIGGVVGDTEPSVLTDTEESDDIEARELVKKGIPLPRLGRTESRGGVVVIELNGCDTPPVRDTCSDVTPDRDTRLYTEYPHSGIPHRGHKWLRLELADTVESGEEAHQISQNLTDCVDIGVLRVPLHRCKCGFAGGDRA